MFQRDPRPSCVYRSYDLVSIDLNAEICHALGQLPRGTARSGGEFSLPTGRLVSKNGVGDISNGLAVYIHDPPAGLEAVDLDPLPRIEDLDNTCIGSAPFSDIHPGRCPLRLGARAGGFGCCGRWRSNGSGGQLRRCATRRRLGFIIDPLRYPQNGNQQQQYRHEHCDWPGAMTSSGIGGPLATESAQASRAHRRHGRHFLATLRAVYEWHWNTRWLMYSRINK